MKKLNIVLLIILLIFSLFSLFPIYWTVITALKVNSEIFTTTPVFFPTKITFSNFYTPGQTFGAVSQTAFGSLPWLINSTVVALLSSLIGTFLIGAPAAYALTHYLKNVWFGRLILLMMMIPEAALIIPFYVIITRVNLINTWWGLTLVYLSFTAPLSTWLLMGFFGDLPRSVEEAASIDGLSAYSIFYRIALPMVMPGIIVSIIINFINAWNEFLYALVLTYTPFPSGAQTVPLFLTDFIVIEKSFAWGGLAAAGVIVMIPSIVIGIYAQKYLVRGWTMGAVKE
jgi:ABC-type glycerol-3-phosphate transport system permease component